MADFDQEEATRVQNEILEDVRNMRNALNADVIEYYWSKEPTSEESDRENREGMRKYLRRAAEHIDAILRGRLA